MKQYEIKVYNLNWTLKETLLWSDVVTDFSYTSQINWWQGEANFVLNKKFSNNNYSIWNFLKVFVFTDYYPNWKLLYSWIINRITRKNTSWIESLQLTCLWLSSILNFLYFYSSWYVFNKNQDPAQTIKDVINYVNTIYTGNWFSYSWWWIQNFWNNINIDFNYTKCFDSIKNIAKATNFRWYIWADGQVIFKDVPITPTHIFTLEKDVEEITLQEDGEKIINNFILTRKSWITTPFFDNFSQTNYWLRELKQDKTDIADIASANIYWNNFIKNNKEFKKKTSISVNSKYNIESINPWDTIKVLNIDFTINNLQIQKITYTSENIKLELDSIDNLWQEIFNF